ncbi:MAG TPA: alpha/beta hydrolase [Spirochaetia bacterium]|nr:alpha/beta hydrolase [Spirochaetia bacterium]
MIDPRYPAGTASGARPGAKELARNRLYDLLGDLPHETDSPVAKLLRTEERSSYDLEHLSLALNGMEEVPALFVKPHHDRADAGGKFPAVLYFHSHGGYYDLGKRELTDGVGYLSDPPYAEVFASLGIAALCIDQWGFGERHRETESALFKRFLWEGRVLFGMMMYDSLRALDYLCSREDTVTNRIATLGMSMGSTHAFWTAAFDERVSLCVDICCLTDYQSLIAAGNIDRHGLYYYVPGLLKYFSTASINSLIAPRRHLGLAGMEDALTPAEGLDIIDAELRSVYAAEGAPANWTLARFPCGHQEIAPMRKLIVDELRGWAGS